jgi:site-specific recombinase XerD
MARASDSKRLSVDVLSDDEVKALIGACSNRAPTGIRNRALIAVMWRCGLRIAEALALTLKDVDLDHGVLSVQRGKGDKSRKVGLDATTSALLARWIDRRRALGHNGRGKPLFCKLDGGSIDQSYVRHLLRRLAGKTGIERRVHPHGLRHAYAAGLAREGTPMNVIRDALGHTSLAVTDRYLRDVAPVHVIQTMQHREWSL